MNAALVSSINKPIIRLAQPYEGKVVQTLLVRFGGAPDNLVSWDDVYPYWLLGEYDGIARGTIMAVPGKPFGRVEFLATDSSLSHRQRAILIRDLCYAAAEACKQGGSQLVLSTISYTNEHWERLVMKRGCIPIDWGTFLCKRV